MNSIRNTPIICRSTDAVNKWSARSTRYVCTIPQYIPKPHIQTDSKLNLRIPPLSGAFSKFHLKLRSFREETPPQGYQHNHLLSAAAYSSTDTSPCRSAVSISHHYFRRCTNATAAPSRDIKNSANSALQRRTSENMFDITLHRLNFYPNGFCPSYGWIAPSHIFSTTFGERASPAR